MNKNLTIKVFTGNVFAGELRLNKLENRSFFLYRNEFPISLTMPPNKNYESYGLLPIFEQYMPEGWLYHFIKNQLSKRFDAVGDFEMFYFLAPGIESFLAFEVPELAVPPVCKLHKPYLSIDDVLDDYDPHEVFQELVRKFAFRSHLGGVQPKVLARLGEYDDNGLLKTKDVIVKTSTGEFPGLVVNEFLCLKAIERAGVSVPKFWLSHNGHFLLIERFDRLDGDNFLGFEETLTLLGKNKEFKYHGSYEQIAKLVRRYSASPEDDLKIFYKMVVLNFLLRNGDAHLKNFGLLYKTPWEKSSVRLAPAYDVVCTTVYIPDDTPALTLFGKKVWYPEKKLKEFGEEFCLLTSEEADTMLKECIEAIMFVLENIEELLSEECMEKHCDFLEVFRKHVHFKVKTVSL